MLDRIRVLFYGDQTKKVDIDESCSGHRGDKKKIQDVDLKPEMKRPLGRPRCKSEYIVMNEGFA
jgi:hypothetical protein